MRISVIGCGYLGAVHAAGMASLGHDVVGIDVDAAKVERLKAGHAPFYEPGFEDLLREQLASGRLRFSTDPSAAHGALVHFVAVGTPQRDESGAADLTAVRAAVAALAPRLRPGDLVVGKSTVPVGTARELLDRLRVVAPGASLAWNPEFLREGFAVGDTLTPDRLVLGVRGGTPEETAIGQRDAALLDEVYATILATGTPRLVMDLETAELVKTAANAFLATKISFINAMSELCEATGADVTRLADAIGHDARIGRRFLGAGLGFGGGCLPKDIRAFRARAEDLGVGEALGFLGEVDAINLRRRTHVVDLAEQLTGGLVGRRVAVLGLAFKPSSDDVRDSPALAVVAELTARGAIVRGYDPEAGANALRVLPELDLAATAFDAARDAEVVIVATEWAEFRDLDPAASGLRELVANPSVIDARNCLDRDAWTAAGWNVVALGRGSHRAVTRSGTGVPAA
ncbi:UDP-glucose/GDP-mannose dehydrogenase family protein [Pseudoclavibacter chungangensis]|uniref:UDP-glucose 6-dehydrogenase n=1 Tax=Pseudoclavibacter chungangensis TaxID=587635 RepID=A0A7J5BTL9_9MICO|nr:UDP-glucose/GDP-mannose dehydrogenase family protein [Pseudoclavibacter chungangensis]KAB1656887.1 UDP-glucose/GDP-mannose dehydrogenase family protein [Pseudoclavibacter chungangensis]NYJ67354.1 UDPglucose 6-dehydrogenase [Pseudoclavibacter chungangensis]